MITLGQYFGIYHDHPDATPEKRAAAERMLAKVNDAIGRAESDGVVVPINPSTGSQISGNRNGGFRPNDCPIGALLSKHKRAKGVDVYDPNRDFARWCYSHGDVLRDLGLCMENVRWTPSWVHLQDIPPGPEGSPWRLDFIPDSSPPVASALKEQS